MRKLTLDVQCSCLPCTEVVRGGSLWLNHKELAYYTPWSPYDDEVLEGL